MRRALPLLLALAALTGCAFERQLGILRLPGSYTSTQVDRADERAGYVDAWLGSQRFFFPADEVCRSVLRAGAEVRYVESGTLGTVESDAGSCEPVGVGTLALWRNTRPRAVRMKANPRAQANFRRVFVDEEVALLRGRFPLARHARMRGDDVIAVVAAREPCLAGDLNEDQTGTLEYREAGPEAFRLFIEGKPCPIEGFVRPLEPH